MKNKTKKLIKTLIFYLIIMTVISIAGYFMSIKQLVELGIFLIAITDYRTDVMHDLLKIEGLQINKIRDLSEYTRRNTSYTINEIQRIHDKLSEMDNTTTINHKVKHFTLED